MALEAKKPVLVEKPVAASVDEVAEMQRLAEAAGVACMPGHNYIYEESLRRSSELIAEGELGRLVSVYVMYNIHHPEEIANRYPGVVRQILTHHSYILMFLAGATLVSALSALAFAAGPERGTDAPSAAPASTAGLDGDLRSSD